MAAHLKRAVRNAKIELIACALHHRCGRGQVLGLEGYALMNVEAIGARFVRNSLVTIKASIEMDTAFHKTRNEKRTCDVVHGCCLRIVRAQRIDCADAATGDSDFVYDSIGQFCVGENYFPCAHRFLPRVLLVDN